MIDNCLQDRRAWRAKKLVHRRTAFCRIVEREAHPAACMRELREVNWMELNAKFGIPQKNHLLPFNLTENIVLDNHDFDRQLIFHCGHKIGHQHGKTAVANKCDHLSIWICNLSRYRIGQPTRHCGKVSRK